MTSSTFVMTRGNILWEHNGNGVGNFDVRKALNVRYKNNLGGNQVSRVGRSMRSNAKTWRSLCFYDQKRIFYRDRRKKTYSGIL